jgi:hypothetical protein
MAAVQPGALAPGPDVTNIIYCNIKERDKNFPTFLFLGEKNI